MRRRLLIFTLLACASACSKASDDARPLATPSAAFGQPGAAIESPVDVTYKFIVASDAVPPAKDYKVFVHFNDPGGEQLWADDHMPPTPTSQWKPGATIQYTRTMFVPKLAYTGRTTVDIGLYSPGDDERVPLSGELVGRRAYRVGSFDVRPQAGSTMVFFRSGWHDVEGAPEGAVEWHWSKEQSTLQFRNPRRDSVLMIDVDQPEMSLNPPQRVDVRIGDQSVASFSVRPGNRDVVRVPLSAAQLGATDHVDVTLAVDRTFSPAYLPGTRSGDFRTLGIRVFHASIQPR
jgi:hypothetical protein